MTDQSTIEAESKLVLERLDTVVTVPSGALHIPVTCPCGNDAVPYCGIGAEKGEWEQKPAANFPGRHDRLCTDCVKAWTVGGLPTETSGAPLTQVQQEAVEAAYHAGFFDIPRSASQGEVADQLGITHQALSERLRRAFRNLVEQTHLVDTRPQARPDGGESDD